MINQDLRDYLKDNYEDAVIFDNPSFDNSIIGVSTDGNIIYHLGKMVNELAKEDCISNEEAMEFIDYNTLRTILYISEGKKPIIMIEFYGEF